MTRRVSSSSLVVALWSVALVLALVLALVWLWPAAAPAPRHQAPRGLRCVPRSPCLVLVIDDIGRDLQMLRRLLALGLDITYSVLPHGPHTSTSVSLLQESGREYMLHLPMRPLDLAKITREPVVVGLDGPVGTSVAECLARVPGAVGVSNHMGSSISQRSDEMARVLVPIQKKRLWFLDSKTTKGSIICKVASKLEMPCRQRDVFLDDPPSPAAVQSRLESVARLARQRGWAIAIGHPKRATYMVMKRFFEKSEINVVRLSALVFSPDAT